MSRSKVSEEFREGGVDMTRTGLVKSYYRCRKFSKRDEDGNGRAGVRQNVYRLTKKILS